MAKIKQNIFNRKKLDSILSNINPELFIEHTTAQDIKRITANWCSLIEKGVLEGKNEISLQDSFLSDIFGRILDYKFIHESPNESHEEWHLDRERRTITDSTRSDAALGFFRPENEDVRVIIELKSAKTNLDVKQKRKDTNNTPIEQAFLYSVKHTPKCKWVIVSNYREIRLYNRSASMNEYEVFFIEKLKNETELKRFLYLLSRKNLIQKNKDSIIDRLYSSNEAEQEKISKEFYKKYKSLRLHVFEHLKEKNSKYDELILLEKTQKILDRFIFICYCADLELLPERIFRRMIEAGTNPMLFVNISQWDQFNGLFRAIDKGKTSSNINKFNGGLFEFDDILDNKLIIGDEIFNELAEISDYDFESELNINILGHIFEQSISDIEELKASIEGEPFDKKNGKRKKDGIYYTPEYISRYIVEQAVGGWLEDKKKELGFEELPELTEKDFNSIKYYKKQAGIKSSNQNIKDHLEFWLLYQKTLSDIKILDPACGSGAFLNQAFDFLYKEGQHVNERIAKLQKGQIELFRLDEHILKNNLFGVDLNSESVEITKLSLWLKTADRNSELTSLDKNIRCGNSLIDDPEIAGDKAFKWEHEFPEIMGHGGFDVVIGNPPYVQVKEDRAYYSCHYETAICNDLYAYFIEKGILLLQNGGVLSFIVSSLFIKGLIYDSLRNFLLKYTEILEILDKGDGIFENVQMPTAVIVTRKRKNVDQTWKQFIPGNGIISKIEYNGILIKNLSKIQRGLEIGKDKIMKAGDVAILTGADISRYFINKIQFISNEIYNKFKKDEFYFSGERVVIRETGKKITSFYTNKPIQQNRSLYSIKIIDNNYSPLYLLAILNSSLIQFYYRSKYSANTNVFPKIRIAQVRDIPIRKRSGDDQRPFITKADTMLSKNKELHKFKADFLELLKSELSPPKISRKLENWPALDWEGFKKELTKCKAKGLSLKERKEWQAYFAEQKQKAAEIKAIINKTDREIDRMVYELYGLTQEEIQVVEST
jgi:type I restriction-modification system DNA methylase subunit